LNFYFVSRNRLTAPRSGVPGESMMRRPISSSSLAISRGGLIILILAALATTSSLGYASPPDLSWIPGIYDDADFDDVVGLATSETSLVGPSPCPARDIPGSAATGIGNHQLPDGRSPRPRPARPLSITSRTIPTGHRREPPTVGSLSCTEDMEMTPPNETAAQGQRAGPLCVASEGGQCDEKPVPKRLDRDGRLVDAEGAHPLTIQGQWHASPSR